MKKAPTSGLLFGNLRFELYWPHSHLGSEHLGVVLQDGSTEADGVRHQVDLLHSHGVLDVVHRVLEVAQELV